LNKLYILFISLFLAKLSAGQKEMNFWHFGLKVALDFNSGDPTAIYNSKLSTEEGSSSISDSLGNLLFYTNGIYVWNKNDLLMPNGTDLFGHTSSTQSALIVKKPGSQSIYYIFTSDAQYGANGINYSEVDMSLHGGLGDVTMKNFPLQTPSCEKLIGIRHCNQRDVWVVTHDWNSSAFRTFLVNEAGVNPLPVISITGLMVHGQYGVGSTHNNVAGQLKASPNGKKIASAIEKPIARFELFDFDNLTGRVSNEILFPAISRECYGVEFSPDGTKMYGSSNLNIFQFDLTLPTANAISQSAMTVAATTTIVPWDLRINTFGSLQLGPDKKIYCVRYASPVGSMGVINEPNKRGAASKYVENGISVGNLTMLGLPNFINTYTKQVPTYFPFTSTVSCLEVSFKSPRTNGIDSVLFVKWNFGDQESGIKNGSTHRDPVHLFSKAGTFEINLELHYRCSQNVIKQKLIIDTIKAIHTEISGVSAFCADEIPVLSTSVSGTIRWSTGEDSQSIEALPFTKEYSVVITTSAGCTYTASKIITVNHLPVTSAKANTLTELSSELHATGGVMFEWSPPDGLSNAYAQDPIAMYYGDMTYCVKITDQNGCSNTSCVDVFVSSAYIPNTFTPNDDNLNDIFKPVVKEVHDYSLQVFDRWGKKIFESRQAGTGWNGKYNGDECEANTYIFKLNFTDNIKNKPQEYSGTVTLVR
jgi:gliding motility-associated-like protein